MNLIEFEKLWYKSPSPTIWCEEYAHPLHRLCPVILDYENLPLPFSNVAKEMKHKGNSGDKVHLTPMKCFECNKNIINVNGGICDPL